MLDSCWCGFIEKELVRQRGAEDYISGHVSKFHSKDIIEQPGGLFERELCHLNHKYKLTRFEECRDAT